MLNFDSEIYLQQHATPNTLWPHKSSIPHLPKFSFSQQVTFIFLEEWTDTLEIKVKTTTDRKRRSEKHGIEGSRFYSIIN